jgi:hypothetical protein
MTLLSNNIPNEPGFGPSQMQGGIGPIYPSLSKTIRGPVRILIEKIVRSKKKFSSKHLIIREEITKMSVTAYQQPSGLFFLCSKWSILVIRSLRFRAFLGAGLG